MLLISVYFTKTNLIEILINLFMTEQVILTYIYKDRPELFYKLADGYCEVIKYLYDYRNTDIFINIITFLFC